MNLVKLALAGFLMTFLAGCGVDRIGPGHVGIKINMAGDNKGVLDTPVSTGWVFYNPLGTTVIEYPTNMKNVVWTKSLDEGNAKDESITFTNKESMVVNADFSLNYYLLPEKVPAFYVKFLQRDLDDFSNGYLRTIARNCVNDSAGKYEIAQIMGDNTAFLLDSKACINKTLTSYGIFVDSFGLIGAPRPPPVVIENINAKIQAQQIALQKQNELLQVQADAAKQVAAAEGKAKSMVTEANGEAEANRIRAASITPAIIQKLSLENQHDAIWRWDGHMPTTVANGDKGGLLFNIPTDSK